jgi:hypothetical protein
MAPCCKSRLGEGFVRGLGMCEWHAGVVKSPRVRPVFVGREAELETLAGAFDEAADRTLGAVPSAIRGQRNHAKKIIVKQYAGNPRIRIERGMGQQAQQGTAPLTTNGRERETTHVDWLAGATAGKGGRNGCGGLGG